MTCEIAGCDRPLLCVGLCKAHYVRKQRYGDPEYTPPSRPGGKPKQKDPCYAEKCDDLAIAKGLCSKHYNRWLRYGDPNKGRDRKVPDHLLSYWGAHARVRAANGSARLRECVECGGAAMDWAYQHTDPDELNAYIEGGYVSGWVTYSPKPEHYAPMCRSCHTTMDKRHKKEGAP